LYLYAKITQRFRKIIRNLVSEFLFKVEIFNLSEEKKAHRSSNKRFNGIYFKIAFYRKITNAYDDETKM